MADPQQLQHVAAQQVQAQLRAHHGLSGGLHQVQLLQGGLQVVHRGALVKPAQRDLGITFQQAGGVGRQGGAHVGIGQGGGHRGRCGAGAGFDVPGHAAVHLLPLGQRQGVVQRLPVGVVHKGMPVWQAVVRLGLDEQVVGRQCLAGLPQRCRLGLQRGGQQGGG